MFSTLDQIIYDQKNEIETLKELIVKLQHELVEKNKEIRKMELRPNLRLN